MLRQPLSLLPSGGCYEQLSIRMAPAMRVANMSTQTDLVLAATYAATAEAPQVV